MAPLKKPQSDSQASGAPPVDKNRYRSMVENLPSIVALIDAEGNIEYVSPYTEKVLGFRREEVEGSNIFNFVHPDDATRAAREYLDTVENRGERVPSVLRLRDVTGAWVPFEIVANNRLLDAHMRAVIFTAHDVRFRNEVEDAIRRANADNEEQVERRTIELAKINAALRIENQARRQAENQLRHTVSLLKATLDSTADGILVVSTDGKVTSCNQKFAEMWGVNCDPTIGDFDGNLIEGVIDKLQSPNEFLDRVHELYSDPTATSVDVLHFSDGRIVERNSQPQRIDDEIVGRVWSFRDVTRARNLELELRQSQKMEALGRLAGGIAHDFNNLLMLISGYARQLVENPALAEGHATCDQILETVNRAASVTRQLLAFSRKHPYSPIATDLNAIVLNTGHMLRRLLSSQTELQIKVAIDPQPVYVDVSQIEVMIMNLVINAQDAMPDGGLLSMATNTEVTSSGEANGDENSKGYAVLQVSDTGHGMTPEIQAHIFEPFFTTKQVGKGTGLGLSTVFGIVERSGGHVDVQSQPGHGTTFRIYLPHVAAPVAKSVTEIVSPPVGGKETILVAEDEAGIRAMTRAYLEGLGYHVLEATDGSEAVNVSLEFGGTIHLILSDVMLPGIRGDASVAAIRKQRPDIKVIYVSGYADQSSEANLDSILYKPFEFPELGRRVRSVLDADSPRLERTDPAA